MIAPSKVKRRIYVKELTGILTMYMDAILSNRGSTTIESIAFILDSFDQLTPKRILDFGAGFNSVAFRWYFLKNIHKRLNRLLTVDVDPLQLNKIKSFCQTANLPQYEFLTWFEIREIQEPFDFLLLDCKYLESRPNYYTTLFDSFVDIHSVVMFNSPTNKIDSFMESYNSKEMNIEVETDNGTTYSRLFYGIDKKNKDILRQL
jgi:hypothetical protein